MPPGRSNSLAPRCPVGLMGADLQIRSSRMSRRLAVFALALLLLEACGASGGDGLPPTPIVADFDVQGHRGARGLSPENTLPAFETALDLGVTTLELDLHFSADGQIVVWHDPVVGPDKCRLRDNAPSTIPDPDDPRTHAERAVAALTSDQLQWFYCDRNPSEGDFPEQVAEATELAGDDYRVVTLVELFEFVEKYRDSAVKSETQRATAATIRFNVETKRRPDDPATIGDGFDGITPGPFELALVDLISRFGLEDRVIAQSFDHRSLWAVHSIAPDLSLAALTPDRFTDLETLAGNGASIWSPRYTSLRSQDIEDAHRLGLEVIPWTVNDPADFADMISMDVDGIITDRPDLLLAHLGR